MSILAPISATGLGIVTLQPFPDVTPFSLRAGATYESILSTIRVWLRDELVPYLNDNSAQAIFQTNVDAMIDTVNTALGAQAATVTAALNQAVEEVVTASIPVTDAAVVAALGAVSSSTRDWLNAHFAAGITAPAPSGGDDTPVLQPLVSAAQATNGTVTLQKGTYLANLLTSGSVQQPRIVGQGRDQTFLQAYSNATPVLKMKGGSGTLNGGFLADFTFNAATAGGGIGLQLAGVCGVRWQRIRFAGTFAIGLQFFNESAGEFTEFCSGDAIFRTSVVQPVQYSRAAGNESFHGSGLTKGSVIQQGAATSTNLIIIDNNAFPYGAPLDTAVFFTRAGSSLISNRNLGRNASFQGNIDVEISSGATGITLGDMTNNVTFLQGGPIALQSASGLTFGNVQQVDSVYYIGSSTYAMRRPWRTNVALGPGTTNLLIDRPKSALLHVEVVGSGYNYAYLLHCWANTFDSTGSVTILATDRQLNTAGYGAPTFGWANNLPTITNALFPASGVTAYVTVLPMENPRADDRFSQH